MRAVDVCGEAGSRKPLEFGALWLTDGEHEIPMVTEQMGGVDARDTSALVSPDFHSIVTSKPDRFAMHHQEWLKRIGS